MAQTAQILALAGSLRAESFNRKLLREGIGALEAAGAQVTHLDLREYPLPLFDQDLEAAEGVPANAQAIKALFKQHNGLLIAVPEYNSSVTAVFKNTIDWVSRREEGEAPLECFKGKTAALLSASPGALGGLRGLVHVRAILGNIGVIVLPEQFALSKADAAFDSDGRLRDASQRDTVTAIAQRLAEVAARLA